jgi:hypothetical protein
MISSDPSFSLADVRFCSVIIEYSLADAIPVTIMMTSKTAMVLIFMVPSSGT